METKENKFPSFFRRFCARLIDYALFYSLLFHLLPLLSLQMTMKEEVLLLAFTPMLFIPVEALFLKTFNRTVGKALLRVMVHGKKNLSFTQAIKRSCLTGIKTNTLIIPLLSLFSKKIRNTWNHTCESIVQFSKFSWTQSTIALSFAAICLFGPTLAQNYWKPSPVLFPSHGEVNFSTWNEFQVPESTSKVSFPGAPEEVERLLKIPKIKEPLPYKEYRFINQEQEVTFAISHTKLPKNILKWSSSLVLKGSLSIIKDNESGAKILQKSSTKVASFPALDYRMAKGNMQISGRLMLIDDTLYKLEITYPMHHQDEITPALLYFLDSFQSN